MISCYFLHILCILAPILSSNYGEKIAMRVVEEPSSYGMPAYNAPAPSSSLISRARPSNFSGPPHLRRLEGRCLQKVFDGYKYELCPFANVTQHEQSLRWNPYSGILGVWQEWEIVNNTFVAMLMTEGDSCGDKFRSIKVYFDCGNRTEITSVSEPATCQYELHLSSPLTCHPDSMLVYPTLSLILQRDWNTLESQLHAGLITTKGYNKRLRMIFERAGYVLSPEQLTKFTELSKVTPAEKTNEVQLNTLDECRTEYESLRREVEGLRTLLEVHGITQNTSKTDQQEAPVHSEDAHYINHDTYQYDMHD